LAAAIAWAGGAGALTFEWLPRQAGGAISPALAEEAEASGTFRGVKAVDPWTGALTVAHDEIKGFMAAMIMMYRVDPASLSAGLRPGDKIEFAIDAKSYTIRDVKLIEQAK
jgi:Cu/Ag efflux protein CusF